MDINEVHWNFSDNVTKYLLKPDFETSVIFELLGTFDAVFTVVLRRMSSIILCMCLYLYWIFYKTNAKITS